MNSNQHPSRFLKRFRFAETIGSLAGLASFWAMPLTAAEPPVLTNLSFEQLSQIQITSVSKREEKLSEVAAAVYVITSEDIRRSGVLSIPEALRLAPGMQVARVGSSSWAIDSRGALSPVADRMLVLMDGRSVYDSFFSGIYWDTKDYLLADVDRIEVIRGPGGTIWGANAVNGVVNVISKSARNTQGLLLEGGGGTEEQGFGGARYGFKINDQAYGRVYAKYDTHDDLLTTTGAAANDHWRSTRGGFRTDWEPGVENQYTVQGDFYFNSYRQTTYLPTVVPPYERPLVGSTGAEGGNLSGRWTHAFSGDSELTVQAYWDRTHRDALTYCSTTDTFDVDANHHFALGERNTVSWGAGFREIHDRFADQIPEFIVTPAADTLRLYSAFLQDEFKLVPEKLSLTAGAKVENNDFSGWEIQPTARLLWQAAERQTVWGALTRAVRSPSRSDNALRIQFQTLPPGALGFNTVPALFQAAGGTSEAQITTEWELGYRAELSPNVSLDLAGFYNESDKLFSLSPMGAIPMTNTVPYLLIPVRTGNESTGQAYGTELTLNWQAAEWWRLRLSYSAMHMRFMAPPGVQTDNAAYIPQQLALNSGWNLGNHFQIDAWLRCVDEVRDGGIPAYVTADLRIAWKPREDWEISLVGQNLLDSQHPEYGRAFIEHGPLAEVQRSFYGKVTWRF